MTDARRIMLLPRLFSHARAVAPKVKLEASTIPPSMAQALESGEAEMALGLISGLESGFCQQSLFIQDGVCLANANLPRLESTLSKVGYEREEHVDIGRVGANSAGSDHDGARRPASSDVDTKSSGD